MFQNRDQAGQALAALLRHHQGAVVLALPRGGVPVAVPIAVAVKGPLDLLLVRKVGVPGQPELAVGAVAGPRGDRLVINDAVARMAGLAPAQIDRLADTARAELERRRALWTANRPPPAVAGQTVILVDDGAATGATMRAAVDALRTMGPKRIVVALPVASAEALTALEMIADEVVCLLRPIPFYAVGAHYHDFPQIADDAVQTLLNAAQRNQAPR